MLTQNIALMTGRISYHVNEVNGNTCSPRFGVPLNMTFISDRLATDAGYVTTQIGKWHLGLASTAHTPLGRGYNSSLGFLQGGEDHYTQIWSQTVGNETCQGTDLWFTDKPALGLNDTYGGYIYGSLCDLGYPVQTGFNPMLSYPNGSPQSLVSTNAVKHCLILPS